jgi:anti-sigma B factor antagonist
MIVFSPGRNRTALDPGLPFEPVEVTTMVLTAVPSDRPESGRPDHGRAPRGPGARLHVRTEHHDQAVIVYADGQLDHHTCHLLREHAIAALPAARPDVSSATRPAVLAARPRRVVLDLDQVGFCDSCGLDAMVVIFQAARAHHATLVIARPQRLCRRILQRTGLDQHIAVSPTPRHALHRLPPGGTPRAWS